MEALILVKDRDMSIGSRGGGGGSRWKFGNWTTRGH